VYTVSKQYAENGLDRVLTRKKRETPPVPAKVTGEVEAKIIAMACGRPPPGYSRWTLRLYEAYSKKVIGIQLSDTRIELSALSSQCLNRRIDSIAKLRKEIRAWQHDRNRNKKTITWQFTTADARIQLHSLYQVI
jgi:hypothetical protein